jgi:hypothetical protein
VTAKVKTKTRWTKTRKCPACGGRPDDRRYEPDEEQVELGYPPQFRICRTCLAPLLRPRKKPPVRRCVGCRPSEPCQPPPTAGQTGPREPGGGMRPYGHTAAR